MKLIVKLIWSSACVIANYTGVCRFAITETKHYVLVVFLSTQDNAKLKSGFKRIINWNKYQPDPKTHTYKNNI